MNDNWPFSDPPNVATITTTKVLDEGHPILLVTHEEDDGARQFLCGTANDPGDCGVVGLDCIYNRDPGVAELSDLPLGWRAWRDTAGSPWQREENSAHDEE
jgi:hypothetical protein